MTVFLVCCPLLNVCLLNGCLLLPAREIKTVCWSDLALVFPVKAHLCCRMFLSWHPWQEKECKRDRKLSDLQVEGKVNPVVLQIDAKGRDDRRKNGTMPDTLPWEYSCISSLPSLLTHTKCLNARLPE